jgi:serine/threonine protein kinase
MTEPASAIGAVVGGRYELVRKIGRGGMGEVYEARRRDLGDRVAVKLLREEEHDDPETRARFLREARILAQVTSPHVVRIVDFQANEGEVAFLAMEYLEGQNASEAVHARGPFSAREVLPLAKQLCAGVGAIHALGLVHRDIKPQNIMIVDGGALGPLLKLVDFGLAKSTHGTERPLTSHLSVLGTPSYMAPEQVGGNATIDSRADVYGTAATFVAMATGKTLYEDEGVAVVTAILAGKRLSVHRVAPELGPALCATLERALSSDRTLRHATIEELSAEIERGLLALQSTANATIAGNIGFLLQTVDTPAPSAALLAAPPAPRASTVPTRSRSGTAPLTIPPAVRPPAPTANPTPGPIAPSSGHVPIVTPANPFQPAYPASASQPHAPPSSGTMARASTFSPPSGAHPHAGTYPAASGNCTFPPASSGHGSGGLPHGGTFPPGSVPQGTFPSGSGGLADVYPQPSAVGYPPRGAAYPHAPTPIASAPFPSGPRSSGYGSTIAIALGTAAVLLVAVGAGAIFFVRSTASAPPPAQKATPTSTAVVTSAETPGKDFVTTPPPSIHCTEGPAKCAAACARIGAAWKSCAGGCANTDDDALNCGSCGRTCANAPACRNAKTCLCRGGRCVTK